MSNERPWGRWEFRAPSGADRARERRLCRRCGYAYINVCHDLPEERRDDPYHQDNPDVPLCDFQP